MFKEEGEGATSLKIHVPSVHLIIHYLRTKRAESTEQHFLEFVKPRQEIVN